MDIEYDIFLYWLILVKVVVAIKYNHYFCNDTNKISSNAPIGATIHFFSHSQLKNLPLKRESQTPIIHPVNNNTDANITIT